MKRIILLFKRYNPPTDIVKLDDVIIKYRKDTIDEFVMNEVFPEDVYSVDDLCLNERSTVVDVGAHIGCFTLRAAKIAKKGRIFSYEPEPDNFRILKNNIKLNKLNNVYLFKRAMLDRSGRCRLYMPPPKYTGEHSIVRHMASIKHVACRSRLVNCISLETALVENRIDKVDLLKLDCEGAEYKILYNTPREYFDKIDSIIMEYHHYEGTGSDINEIKDFLGNKGFLKAIIKPNPKDVFIGLAYFSKRP